MNASHVCGGFPPGTKESRAHRLFSSHSLKSPVSVIVAHHSLSSVAAATDSCYNELATSKSGDTLHQTCFSPVFVVSIILIPLDHRSHFVHLLFMLFARAVVAFLSCITFLLKLWQLSNKEQNKKKSCHAGAPSCAPHHSVRLYILGRWFCFVITTCYILHDRHSVAAGSRFFKAYKGLKCQKYNMIKFPETCTKHKQINVWCLLPSSAV